MVACHSMSGKSGLQGFSTSLWMAVENVLYIIVYNSIIYIYDITPQR